MTDAEILAALPRLRALIIGDICLDRWCRYDPALSLPSAETGIPRVAVVTTESTAGAGGTVAGNLAALGVGRVAVLGVIGDDGNGYELRRALARRGIRDLLVEARNRQTFAYTKLINRVTDIEDLARVDFVFAPVPETQPTVLNRLLEAVDDYDLFLISDQSETDAGGVVTEAVRVLLAELAAVYRDKIFLADSRRRAHLFSGLMLKVNGTEAEAASRAALGRVDFAALREHTKAPVLFVTQGGGPVRVFDLAGESLVSVRTIENPVDICGAGDSFAAGAAAALFLTRDPARAADFGSTVASITIRKRGTGTASPEEILQETRGGSRFALEIQTP
jgi:bifunctional ADP-heptose synthase (sugar kinase/adenylyltransferase)